MTKKSNEEKDNLKETMKNIENHYHHENVKSVVLRLVKVNPIVLLVLIHIEENILYVDLRVVKNYGDLGYTLVKTTHLKTKI